jgi:hypothetical protein
MSLALLERVELFWMLEKVLNERRPPRILGLIAESEGEAIRHSIRDRVSADRYSCADPRHCAPRLILNNPHCIFGFHTSRTGGEYLSGDDFNFALSVP